MDLKRQIDNNIAQLVRRRDQAIRCGDLDEAVRCKTQIDAFLDRRHALAVPTR